MSNFLGCQLWICTYPYYLVCGSEIPQIELNKIESDENILMMYLIHPFKKRQDIDKDNIYGLQIVR